MNETIEVREATLLDLPVILHQRRQMFHDMGLVDPAALDAMDATAEPFFRRALSDASYRGWLAVETNGRVVAGGGIWLAPWPPHPRSPIPVRPFILNMFTEPEYRKRGLARRVMEVIMDWCRTQGFGWVSLHASEQGRPLYASLGFELGNEMRIHLK